jgi:hypothetical protein
LNSFHCEWPENFDFRALWQWTAFTEGPTVSGKEKEIERNWKVTVRGILALGSVGIVAGEPPMPLPPLTSATGAQTDFTPRILKTEADRTIEVLRLEATFFVFIIMTALYTSEFGPQNGIPGPSAKRAASFIDQVN